MDELPELLHRRRFVAVPGLTVVRTASNVIVVRIPKSDEVRRLLRDDVTPERFDDAVWAVGEDESVQSLGSADGPDHVEVTIVLP
ncbi:MAG: hypothetical protein AAF211_01940 [Myxococcota bacterium]